MKYIFVFSVSAAIVVIVFIGNIDIMHQIEARAKTIFK